MACNIFEIHWIHSVWMSFVILLYLIKLNGSVLVLPCPFFPFSSHPSVDIIVSALYFPQCYLDPFHIYTSYQPSSEDVSVLFFFNSKNIIFPKCFEFMTLHIMFYVTRDLGLTHDFALDIQHKSLSPSWVYFRVLWNQPDLVITACRTLYGRNMVYCNSQRNEFYLLKWQYVCKSIA